ncbi:MAG: DUF4124 domain-containing protein [Chromatiales bacterium]|jgi:hypothetical protein
MRILILLLATLALGAQATSVYRWVDENGNVVFSDEPPADRQSDQIEVPPANVIRGLPAERRSSRPDAAAPEAPTETGYRSLVIVYPEPGSSVRQNAGNVSVRASLEPALGDGHTLELLLDGEPVASSTSGEFELSNVDRGTHELVVQVVDGGAQSLIRSEPLRFTLHRHSIRNPR